MNCLRVAKISNDSWKIYSKKSIAVKKKTTNLPTTSPYSNVASNGFKKAVKTKKMST